ncbi:origin recognition complex subunit 2 [Cephus cinctus]|uniref:Origin recognition complex subunit 2 n=1 Tax=Cephus cinctus TaxID=211228 RepID=A0AAJ7C908_CEPCN|nr:origin recognition complex subunit 2 [Cephus cinctus]XP_024945272.1 origin recognition complex subunit 2 [Cephus cinctus]
MSDSSETLRRSSRIKAPVNYADKSEIRIRRHSSSATSTASTDVLETELEKELENVEENVQKPSELFTDEDVSGTRMYQFQTPSKKDAMVQKAISCRNNITPSTPKFKPKLQIIIEATKTPHHIRTKIKKQLASINRKNIASGLTSSESESVSEDSEFVPSDDETDDHNTDEQSENEIHSDEESDGEAKQPTRDKSPSRRLQITFTTSSSKGKSISNAICSEFHLKTDQYFENQSAKVLTSDHTLGRLKTPRLNEEKIQELLVNQNHVSQEHKNGIKSLSKIYRSFFPMWYFIMEEGYSILLHGIGSKRNLINDFYKEIIYDHPTLVVNGFFPSLTIKEILDGIIVDLLELTSPTNTNECINLIENILKENPDDRLYLLIHNIDGQMLRSDKTQDILSRLAAIPNLCLMASVDHINAPLLWDNVKRSRYNFYWWDSTTLLPYVAETSYENSLMVKQSGSLALSSLRNVFLSLTSNAKSIYILLVKHQLENNSKNYPGMAFKDLYWGAREAFLVSSDLALRAQLTEFVDHKLVRNKRNVDGAEYLIIPLEDALLKQFLEQYEET